MQKIKQKLNSNKFQTKYIEINARQGQETWNLYGFFFQKKLDFVAIHMALNRVSFLFGNFHYQCQARF